LVLGVRLQKKWVVEETILIFILIFRAPPPGRGVFPPAGGEGCSISKNDLAWELAEDRSHLVLCRPRAPVPSYRRAGARPS